MPRISEELIDQVRQSVDIVDVISDHVALIRKGKSFLGLCPFHDDSSPSMNVSQDKQIYKCFSCGAGGNVFTFVRDIENISFIEAVRKLAERAGIALPDSRSDNSENEKTYDELYRANELALKYFHHMLMEHESGSIAREYLAHRGMLRDTMVSFQLGYALNQWDGFLQAATRRGYSLQVLERAGLITPRQKGTGYYDRFRHRVMFPIHASTGRPVAFGARALDIDEQAKYLNSPETPVYHKSATLYGLWRGRDAIRNTQQALVVEGYMDLISLVQNGIENVVASSGTALTSDHARMLRRYASHIVLVFDGDEAGTGATVRGIGSLFEMGLDVRVVSLPQGHDPDSFVREHGPDGFYALIEKASSAVDFLIHRFSTREDLSSIDGKTRAAHELAELIGRIKDQARRQFLIQDVSQKLRMEESVFIQIVHADTRQTPSRRSTAPTGTPPPFDPRPRSERELLYLMMRNPDAADFVLHHIRMEDFTNSTYRQMVRLIAQLRQNRQNPTVANLIDHCRDPQLSRIISDLFLEPGMPDPDQVPLDDYIRNFKMKNIERQLDDLQAQMSGSIPAETMRSLMEKHRELTAQRRELVVSSS